MSEMSRELTEELSLLKSAFIIDVAKLKEIVNHFVEELDDGELRTLLPHV